MQTQQTKALAKPLSIFYFGLILSLGFLAACSKSDLPAYCTGLCIEAETGLPLGAFIRVQSAEASGGAFVRSLYHNEADIHNHMQAPDQKDSLTFEFEAEPGKYTIKAWVSAKDLASDSFYVKLNSQPYFVYSFNNTAANSVFPEFVEDNLREASDDPKVFTLVKRNTLIFYMRETGAGLDRLELIPLNP